MNRLLRHKNFMLIFMYFIIVFSLSYLVGTMLTLDLSLVSQILIVFAVAISAKLIVQNRVFIYIIFFIVVISRFIPDDITPQSHIYFEKLMMVLSNVYEHLFMNKLIMRENILPFWIITIAVYSIYTSFIIFRLKRGLWALLLLYIPMFIYYWYVNIRHTYSALAVFLFSYLVIYGQLKFEKEAHMTTTSSDHNFSEMTSSWHKVSLIYGALIIIIALLMPKTPNHTRWLWMESKINSMLPENHYLRLINNEYNDMVSRFNFSTTGFQQNLSVLGGPVSSGENLIMYVYADKPTYLRGTVRHNYNGSMWQTLETGNTEYPLGNALNNITPDEMDYYNEETVKVQFVNYTSTTLFSPYRTIDVHAESKDKISVSMDHIIEIPGGIYNGEEYTVTFLSTPSYYESLNTGINNSYNNLSNIGDYLDVPMDKITQRTIDLKDEIITGIEGNYEKAVAFESYLRNNYTYTLDTSVVPYGHEFIDYFLFEEKAGYCTYYATAMAIFLRLEGIPSRYVEGYVSHESSYDGVYEVRQSNAHAWVEAYIEPVGWITFEPTASYPSENRSRYDSLGSENKEEAPADEPSDETDIEKEDNETEKEEALPDNQDTAANDSENSDSTENESSTGRSVSPQNIIFYMIGLMLLTAMIPVLIKVFKYRKNEQHIDAMPDNEKIIEIYQRILKTIEVLGYPMDYGETYYEYSVRMGHQFDRLEELTDIFVKNKYGDIMPGDDEIQKFTDYRSILEEQLKNHLGTIKYYFHKYTA
ncbi:transglutaminase domain-containing protein [Sedimentibacter sp.]|uniref:transglutaminase-like domain-containing protein n=1 Tax=Sedimentibacter sp. TaxID=1960295 RepID=UPI0028968D50|nr:transglutaminase domain-containing protein [Sedimentibacter sp.]